MTRRIAGLAVLALVLTACGGGSGGDDGVTRISAPPEELLEVADDGSPDGRSDAPIQRISGMVFDARTGAPVSGATIQTNPVTENVTTDRDGAYVIDDSVNAAGRYQVTASRLGYAAAQSIVSVAENDVTTADFQLDPIVSGLAVNVPSLSFGPGRDSVSIVLTSTAADTGFTVDTGASWLRVVPASGTIVENENRLIRVEVDRSGLSGTRLATSLVINTSNGLPGVVLDVTVDIEPAGEDLSETVSDPTGGGVQMPVTTPAGAPVEVSPAPSADQADCRRADLLSAEFGVDGLSFVADTIGVPGSEGRFARGTLPLSAHTEAIQVLRSGTLRIAHVADGAPNTDAALYDVDRNNTVRRYAANDRGRAGFAELSAVLEPGLYCYFVRPDGGYFSFGRIELAIDFEPGLPKAR